MQIKPQKSKQGILGKRKIMIPYKRDPHRICLLPGASKRRLLLRICPGSGIKGITAAPNSYTS